MWRFIKLHILLALGLLLVGCSEVTSSIQYLYCNTTSELGKQVIRNRLTGGTQFVYCSKESREVGEKERIQIHPVGQEDLD